MVNENSTSYLTVTFYDESSEPVTPDSITWKVHDKSTGTELQPATSVPVGTSVELVISPTINRILNSIHKEETRVVTVETTYGSTQQFNADYEYSVKNLRHL